MCVLRVCVSVLACGMWVYVCMRAFAFALGMVVLGVSSKKRCGEGPHTPLVVAGKSLGSSRLMWALQKTAKEAVQLIIIIGVIVCWITPVA